jgi:predicted acetyltransferase
MSLPVTISRAEPFERSLIEGLFQFYIYDFSEFEAAGSDRFDVNAEARFEPYPLLDQYWRDPDCVPLLIRVGGELAGFALINAFAHSGGACDRSMAEFFIMRKYRRDGVGAAAVADVLALYPGRWEIAVARRNVPAIAFWPRVVGALARVKDLTIADFDTEMWRGPILQFTVIDG